jgi:hypothetical protein
MPGARNVLTISCLPPQSVQWMDAPTKAEALLKIDSLSPQVGRQDPAFDDRWSARFVCCELRSGDN